jgi:hypothetical protein
MANSKKATVTLEELLFSSLAQTDALSKLLIEAGPSGPDRGGASDVPAALEGNGTLRVEGTCEVT